MKERFSQIKKNSLLALKHHWGRAICVLILYFLVWIFLFIAENLAAYLLNISGFQNLLSNPSLLPGKVDLSLPAFLFNTAVTIIHLLVIPPLTLGCLRWFYELISDKECDLTEIWHYFMKCKRFLKAFLFSLAVIIRSMLWMVLFLLPGIVVLTLSIFLSGSAGENSQVLLGVFGFLLGTVLLLIGSICWLIYNSRYFLSFFFYFEDETIGIHRAIQLSVQNMKGMKLQYGKFLLCFSGWMILGVLLLPLLFVLPYMACAFSILAKLGIENYKRAESTRKYLKNAAYTVEYKTGDLHPVRSPGDDSQQTLTDLGPLGLNRSPS